MNAIELLRDQLNSVHATQEATVADLTDTSAHFKETGKAMPAGAAYAHSVISEDMIVSGMLQSKTPLSQDAETGLSIPMPSFDKWDTHEQWVKTVKVDLPKLKAFAQKVYKATDEYLARLTEKDLDQEMERPVIGKHKLAFFIANFVILHIANLTGEISAAKGRQGLKGYPF